MDMEQDTEFGFFLNVHEGPQSISKFNSVDLREGMIVSNEPGYYEEGKFGIRIENLIYVRKNKKNYNLGIWLWHQLIKILLTKIYWHQVEKNIFLNTI